MSQLIAVWSTATVTRSGRWRRPRPRRRHPGDRGGAPAGPAAGRRVDPPADDDPSRARRTAQVPSGATATSCTADRVGVELLDGVPLRSSEGDHAVGPQLGRTGRETPAGPDPRSVGTTPGAASAVPSTVDPQSGVAGRPRPTGRRSRRHRRSRPSSSRGGAGKVPEIPVSRCVRANGSTSISCQREEIGAAASGSATSSEEPAAVGRDRPGHGHATDLVALEDQPGAAVHGGDDPEPGDAVEQPAPITALSSGEGAASARPPTPGDVQDHARLGVRPDRPHDQRRPRYAKLSVRPDRTAPGPAGPRESARPARPARCSASSAARRARVSGVSASRTACAASSRDDVQRRPSSTGPRAGPPRASDGGVPVRCDGVLRQPLGADGQARDGQRGDEDAARGRGPAPAGPRGSVPDAHRSAGGRVVTGRGRLVPASDRPRARRPPAGRDGRRHGVRRGAGRPAGTRARRRRGRRVALRRPESELGLGAQRDQAGAVRRARRGRPASRRTARPARAPARSTAAAPPRPGPRRRAGRARGSTRSTKRERVDVAAGTARA